MHEYKSLRKTKHMELGVLAVARDTSNGEEQCLCQVKTGAAWRRKSPKRLANGLRRGAAKRRNTMDERSTQGDALRANLEALLEHVPILRNHAVDVALGPYRDLILQAHTQGHTYRAIAQAIRDAGFAVSPETVRRYVLRNGATPKRPRSRYEKLLRTRAT